MQKCLFIETPEEVVMYKRDNMKTDAFFTEKEIKNEGMDTIYMII